MSSLYVNICACITDIEYNTESALVLKAVKIVDLLLLKLEVLHDIITMYKGGE